MHAGDHIWWDLHDWGQTDYIPAVVGSFPEPFLNGIEGKRLPVRVECAEPRRRCLRTVAARLRAPACPPRSPRSGRRRRSPKALRVLVGTVVELVHRDLGVAEHRAGAARERRLRALLRRAAARSRCSTPTGTLRAHAQRAARV